MERTISVLSFSRGVANFLVRRASWGGGCLPREVWGGCEGPCVEGALPTLPGWPGEPFPLLSNDLGPFAVGTFASWLRFKSPIQGEREFFRVAETLAGRWFEAGACTLSSRRGGGQHHFADCFLRPLPRGTGSWSPGKSLRDPSGPSFRRCRKW